MIRSLPVSRFHCPLTPFHLVCLQHLSLFPNSIGLLILKQHDNLLQQIAFLQYLLGSDMVCGRDRL